MCFSRECESKISRIATIIPFREAHSTNVLNSYVLLTYKRSGLRSFFTVMPEPGGQRGYCPPPLIFCWSVIPIPTGGGKIVPNHYYWLPQTFSPSGFYVMSSLVACQNCYKLAYLFILIHIVYRPLIFQIKFYNLAYLSMLIHTLHISPEFCKTFCYILAYRFSQNMNEKLLGFLPCSV